MTGQATARLGLADGLDRRRGGRHGLPWAAGLAAALGILFAGCAGPGAPAPETFADAWGPLATCSQDVAGVRADCTNLVQPIPLAPTGPNWSCRAEWILPDIHIFFLAKPNGDTTLALDQASRDYDALGWIRIHQAGQSTLRFFEGRPGGQIGGLEIEDDGFTFDIRAFEFDLSWNPEDAFDRARVLSTAIDETPWFIASFESEAGTVYVHPMERSPAEEPYQVRGSEVTISASNASVTTAATVWYASHGLEYQAAGILPNLEDPCPNWRG